MKVQNFKSKLDKFLKTGLPATFKLKKIKKMPKKRWILSLLILVIFCLGIFAGGAYGDYLWQGLKKGAIELNNYFRIFPEVKEPVVIEPAQLEPSTGTDGGQAYTPQTTQEEAVIKVVKEVSPAVVSIIITKDLPVYEQYYESPFGEFFGIPQYRQKGTQKQKIGGGTGFVISEDGMILTNKHVVSYAEVDYTVLTNEGQRYSARVLARDPFQDLAILKVEKEKIIDEQGEFVQKLFSVVKLGDSSNLQIGQTVVAIGNALGEFRNTVSVGVISGLGRTITASGAGIIETLEDVIQTDAAINEGNSGGPLLNLRGEVIGVNVAMAQEAQSIGFAIPIDKAKRDIEQVKTIGKIVYPFLGIRYILITPEIQEEKNLSVDYGALIVRGDSPAEPAIVPDSVAAEAGL